MTDEKNLVDDDAREALIGMVALWEHIFDAERRCMCNVDDPKLSMRESILKQARNPDEYTKCAYCVAKELLDRNRLAMGESVVGRG